MAWVHSTLIPITSKQKPVTSHELARALLKAQDVSVYSKHSNLLSEHPVTGVEIVANGTTGFVLLTTETEVTRV